MSERNGRSESAPLDDATQEAIRNRAVATIRNFREAGRQYGSHVALMPAVMSASFQVAHFAHKYPEKFKTIRYEEDDEHFANEKLFTGFIPYDVQTDTVSEPFSLHRLSEKYHGSRLGSTSNLYQVEKMTGVHFSFAAAGDRVLYMQGEVIDYQLQDGPSKGLFSATIVLDQANPNKYEMASTNLTNFIEGASRDYQQLHGLIGQELNVVEGKPYELPDQQDLFMGILSKVTQAITE